MIARANVSLIFPVYSSLNNVNSQAIYCYTPDGRGPCYAVDGEKIMLEWFRSYLIIISKGHRPTAISASTEQEYLLTVLDIFNQFIVYQSVMPNIRYEVNSVSRGRSNYFIGLFCMNGAPFSSCVKTTESTTWMRRTCSPNQRFFSRRTCMMWQLVQRKASNITWMGWSIFSNNMGTICAIKATIRELQISIRKQSENWNPAM